MKTSWTIGLVFFYIALLLLTSVVNQASQFTVTEVARLQGFMQPTGTDVASSSTSIPAALNMITNVWTYIVVYIEMIFLWSPTLWSGTWIWMYYFICLPVCIGNIISIVYIMRGVANG